MQWSANRHCQPYGPSVDQVPVPVGGQRGPDAGVGRTVRGGGPAEPRVGPVDDPHPRVGAQRCDDRGAVTDQRPVADAGPVALPGRGVEHPQPTVVGPVGCARGLVIELGPTDLADPGVGVEVVERSSQPLPTGRPTDEGDRRTPCAGSRRCRPCRSRRGRSGCARARRTGASGSSAPPGWGRAPPRTGAARPGSPAPRWLGRRRSAGCCWRAPADRCRAGRRSPPPVVEWRAPPTAAATARTGRRSPVRPRRTAPPPRPAPGRSP